MNTQHWRIVGAVTGFAFAAVWVAAGLVAALGCLVAAGAGVAVVVTAERWSTAAIRAHATKLRQVRLPQAPQKAKVQLRRERVRAPEWPSQESTYGW